MLSLVNCFTNLGWSRDDWKWTWGQLVGVAALIVSGVFDVQHWAEYVGLHLTVVQVHIVQATSGAILWLSSRMTASNLPSKAAAEQVKEAVREAEIKDEINKQEKP